MFVEGKLIYSNLIFVHFVSMQTVLKKAGYDVQMYHERHILLYTPENNHSVNDWYMESERFELCDQINNAKFS